MKRVKLYYKGQEIGVYDNKKDAQCVVVLRMNENPDVSVFAFGIEYVEFPLTVREAKEVLGTSEKTCYLLSGNGGVTVSRTKLQALCNEADASSLNALLAFNKLMTLAKAWDKIDNFKPSYESGVEMFIPCSEAFGGDFKLICVSQALKAAIKYPAEMCFKTAESAARFGKLFEEDYKKLLL
mgnify:CR=1 FL=1|jgi:hypothetical protein|nr:MAG TPA: hypothetical protein [Bacteriophage sp.]